MYCKTQLKEEVPAQEIISLFKFWQTQKLSMYSVEPQGSFLIILEINLDYFKYRMP